MQLDYNSRVPNTVLQHMRGDQVMQAALRFGRDSDGALVKTFSEQAQAIASAAGELARRAQFTASEVADRVDGHDPSARSVRRVLSELAAFGYLEKVATPNGYANEFSVEGHPGAAEIDLPNVEGRALDEPGQDALDVSYTWSVRVAPGEPRPARHRTAGGAELPPPTQAEDATSASAPPA